ncbi:hypothetical protein ACCI49_22055, partial [Microbulbifer epialgicus]
LVGVVIAALGLVVNWYYSHQRHKLMKAQSWESYNSEKHGYELTIDQLPKHTDSISPHKYQGK